MPSCIVKGCTHYTGMKASNPLLTMHVFPRELSRIKLWLQQIGQIGDIDAFAAKVLDASRTGKYRICSAHFAPGSYTSQGSRIVLKPNAIPTLFPGIYPRPPPDWKPDTAAVSDGADPPAPKATTAQRKEAGPHPKADCQKRLQEGSRRSQGAKQSRPGATAQEQHLDINGRHTGAKESGHRDPKTKADELSYNWSLPADTADENRRALLSLENVMVSLLQHLAEAPLSSRAKKQKTGRLLNQTAEIVSLLTGEEWTVVKKNSHISKFYNMIREVPIKCGDVAVFFSMDEWDYIEDHEDLYKHVMVEEPKSSQYNGSADGMKTDLFLGTAREQRPNFGDLDFEGLFQAAEPPLPDKYEEPLTTKDVQILEMSCSSDDDMDPPQNERIDASPGDKDIGGDLGVPRSPVSSPQETDKPEEKEEDEDAADENDSADKHEEKEEDEDAANEKDSADEVTSDPAPGSPHVADSDPVDAIDDSSISDLWIAQDGTTSSTWIPQDDPRPKGRNCSRYGKSGARIQCPVSLSGTTVICLPEQPLKRAESALDPRCDLCDLPFPDQYELDLHQLTHSKKQRP